MSKEKDDKGKSTLSDSSEESFSLNIGGLFKGPEESIVGTIFVNRENRIKCVISSVTELINLSSFNKDLEIIDFSRQLQYEGGAIEDDIRHVLKHRGRIQKEVPGKDGRWYLLEFRPHSPEVDKDGVVIAFVDVTELKEAQKELAKKIKTIKELQRQIIKNDVSERWKIGRFLHDNLGQTLVSAEIQLQIMKNKIANGEKGVEEDIDQVLDILSESTTDVRDLSHEIVPVDLEEKGIAHAFNKLAKQMEKLHDISCELEYNHTLDDIKGIEIATHLYRIGHEATKNAAVHADAENVTISLKTDKDYLYLNIDDDGTGISDSAIDSGGMGINIMRHRTELIGGTFKIKNTSIYDKGATISCRIPIQEVKNTEYGFH